MAKFAWFVLALILNQIAGFYGEVYSSSSEMRNVLAIERDLVQILDNYAGKIRQKLDQINGYLKEYRAIMSERELVDSEEEFYDRIVGNPIHAYKMMKRFTVDWNKIEKNLKQDDWSEVEFEFKRKRLANSFPKEADLHGSAQALIRLQDVYELDIRDLAKGTIGNNQMLYQSNAQLNAQDCLFLGKHCFNSGALSRSLEWFEEAWIMSRLERNETLTPEQVQSFLDHAAKTHDEKVLRGETGPNLFPRPVYQESPIEQRGKLYKKVEERLRENITNVAAERDYADDLPRFNALCRGEELRPPSYVANLKCQLTHKENPYYYLHPVQEETAHLQPLIRVYHNVVSQREMKIVRDIASPLMMRSQVQGNQAGNSEVSMTRTSKTGWLQDSFDPVIRRLSERINWITKLNTDTWKEDAELLQVANYLNGGHYNPHHDYVMKDKQPDHMIYLENKGLFIGDRIATWMFYLNETPSGGRTVFPRIGAGVQPVAGSAVFWHNLHKSGDPDQLTLHGACPIIFGTKWVSNKWIREGAQTFTRPCGLTKDAL